MPGYSTSVNTTDSGLFLRVSFKNKFVHGKTALSKIEEFQKTCKNGVFRRAVDEYFLKCQVMTTYGSYRVYKVESVNFYKNVNTLTFNVKLKDGTEKEITLMQYYSSMEKLFKTSCNHYLSQVVNHSKETRRKSILYQNFAI